MDLFKPLLTMTSLGLLVLASSQATACSKGGPAPGSDPASSGKAGPASLEIRLRTDKQVYGRGEAVHWTVDYVNTGAAPLRVLVDEEFVGGNIRCANEKGEPIEAEGGHLTWSPKVGVFTGRTHLIAPGGTLTIELDSLVDFRYDLVFRSPGREPQITDEKALKSSLGLPDDYPTVYLSAGWRFRLGQPGHYDFRWIYRAEDNDKLWKFAAARTPEEASVEDLWLGEAGSESLRLEIR